MNVQSRFLFAILLSLFAHVILIEWLQPNTTLILHGEQGVLQVYLRQDTGSHSAQKLSGSVGVTSSIDQQLAPKSNFVQSKSALPPAASTLPGSIVERGNVSSPSPWQPLAHNSQNQYMIAMQQAQVAQQLALRKEAIRAGLTNLALQLRPLILENINCIQKTGDQFECRPIQNEETQKMLKQFFDLAGEANKVGIVENPLRLDLGPGRSVTMILQP
jgi:hypothetical protein